VFEKSIILGLESKFLNSVTSEFPENICPKLLMQIERNSAVITKFGINKLFTGIG
jgi:hypothetical protein